LPARPSWTVTVAVVDPVETDDARVVAARERAGRVENGKRLASFGQWYDALVARYGGSP